MTIIVARYVVFNKRKVNKMIIDEWEIYNWRKRYED